MVFCMVWLVGWVSGLIGWLVGWLVGCVGMLIGWCVEEKVGCDCS